MPAELALADQGLARSAALARRLLPAAALAVSRIGAVGLQLLGQIAVGALAGPAGLGVLQLFNSWSCVAGEVAARGLPTRALREVSVAYAGGNATAVRGAVADACKRILHGWWPSAFLALLLAGLLALPALRPLTGDYLPLAVAVIICAPLFALARLFAEALKGSDAPVLAVSLETMVPPAVLLAACLFSWVSGRDVHTGTLLLAGLAGFGLNALLMYHYLQQRLDSQTAARPAAATAPENLGDTRALWANGVLNIAFLHLPFFLLPLFADTAEIGVYSVAHKLVNIITTLLILMAAVFGPAFARAAARNDNPGLRQLLRRSQVLSSAIYLPLALLLLLGNGGLAGVFNLPPASLAPYLFILAAGQLVNAATGLSGVLLTLTGAATLELRTLIGALLATLVLSPAVGYFAGPLGLACLFSAVIAGKNLASFFVAHRYLTHREHEQ